MNRCWHVPLLAVIIVEMILIGACLAWIVWVALQIWRG